MIIDYEKNKVLKKTKAHKFMINFEFFSRIREYSYEE